MPIPLSARPQPLGLTLLFFTLLCVCLPAAQAQGKTVNNSAAPLYLSRMTFSPTALIGGRTSTGTVTLSRPAPAGGIRVALLSSSAAATVPATCTVRSGVTQATFKITTTAVSASTAVTISGTYNGWTQGDELGVLQAIPPVVPPPGVPLIHVAPGKGCAIVAWNRLADGTVSGYNIYRTRGGTRTLLTPTPFASNFYPDTGLTNDKATYTYQVAAVDTRGREQALSTPVSATPSSAMVTLNWINPPSAVTDRLLMKVSLSSGGQVFDTLFFIDGVKAGEGGDEPRPINGVQTEAAGAGYDSSELSNGPHTVQFIGFADAHQAVAAATSPITIQVSNTISNYSVDSDWFDPTQGELCYLSATVPAGSTWTVQVTRQDDTTVIRSWQGASSFVNLAWDGKDASGKILPITDYALHLTVTSPVPSTAGTAKRTHSLKILRNPPLAPL